MQASPLKSTAIFTLLLLGQVTFIAEAGAYKEIGHSRIKETGDAGFQRLIIRATIKEGLSKPDIEKEINHIIENSLREKPSSRAIAIFLYREGDNIHGPYTVASADWAPYGEWSRIHGTVPKDKYETTIKYASVYFEREVHLKGEAVLKKGVIVSERPDDWSSGYKTHKLEKVEILDVKEYPATPDITLVRYKVSFDHHIGWVHKWDFAEK